MARGIAVCGYLIPGIILLVVLGIGPLLVVIGIFRRLRWAWMVSLLVGLALIIWIIVEVFIVGYIPQPPLQLVYGLVGFGIIGAARMDVLHFAARVVVAPRTPLSLSRS